MSQLLPLAAIEPHPENANVMAEALLGKLQRHIERTGRYEPIIVRPIAPAGGPRGAPRYQVLNGHHRLRVLQRLGHAEVRCEVWDDVDDAEALLLLATLNRLQGRDDPTRRAALLSRLAELRQADARTLARELPESRQGVERAIELARAPLPAPDAATAAGQTTLAPMTFFLTRDQRSRVDRALGAARADSEVCAPAPQEAPPPGSPSPELRGTPRAAALVSLAEAFLATRNGGPA